MFEKTRNKEGVLIRFNLDEMHEESNAMSVTNTITVAQNQNGTTISVPIVTEVDLESINRENSLEENVDLQVSYSSSSTG